MSVHTENGYNHKNDFASIARQVSLELAASAPIREAETRRPTAELRRLRESGLISGTVPAEYGGSGQSWQSAVELVREVSKGDGSVGALFGYHLLDLATTELCGTPAQREHFGIETVRNGWFWGGVINPLDADLVATPTRDGFRLNGRKTFCTGAVLADQILVNAKIPNVEGPAFFAIPGDREGIIPGNDWNNLGLRLTESGSVTFEDVWAAHDERLGGDQPIDPVLSSLNVPMIQLLFTNYYLGSALGALDTARDYILNQSRPWFLSGVERAAQDPYTIATYGDLSVNVNAAVATANHAAGALQLLLDNPDRISPRQRGEVAVQVAAAKVFVARTALDVTSRIYELMGARSTAARFGFDRFWRDVRTHTLHDPLAYKIREVGDYFLNDRIPEPTFYT
jgi:alkylation response protein AidB-like acyl-CoA dehydrogenase